MSKKFITVENGHVTLVHHMPFDSTHGFHKSESELMEMGYLVDTIPDSYDGELSEEQSAKLCYDGNAFSWEIVVDKNKNVVR